MQTIGRIHRSNEAFPPIYKLVSTDLSAQKRFVTSSARRLEQLGALFKSEIQGPVAIEMAEEFFVANGVKGIAISERHDAARLLKHARLNHGINAPANTLKKLGALALQTNFYDAERAVATLPGSKR